MNRRLLVILLVYLMAATSFQQRNLAAGQATKEYVVLFDESHGQFFTRELMTGALNTLEGLIPEENIQIKIIYQNNSRFNSTNLQGVDLLIITNPGIKEENELQTDEISAILDYVELGGSLFLLSNPLTRNESLTGHPASINELLAAREDKLTSARINTANNISHSNLIIDEFSHVYSNESYVLSQIHNGKNITIANYEETKISDLSMTIYQQELQINSTTIYSASLTLANEINEYAVGRTPVTSYAIDENYDIIRDPVNGFLTWMIAKPVGDARLVVSGSTIMFSDLEIAEGQTWINQTDNLNLWKNIVLWLLKYTPHPPRGIPAIWTFRNYALIVLGLSAIVFVSAYLLYKIKQKRKTSLSK
ncbi:MAG: hypothetical protein ACTSYD_01935 [Candidatus Heimdallarchaeaceae archaeon]